ncbi:MULTISPECIES: hypothetical protein [unclassified Frankia]|uniref:hypothetical protein n=1 Tax=unclassified Frankia TaxID=2632575 RepID=UPI002AD248A8|nr:MULTISPECIES: hypothetical protein [unclassified Frankia]
MKIQVEGDGMPPELLVEAATDYACLCCAGVIELWRDSGGYWNATLAHDERCRPERTVTAPRRPELVVAG